MPTPIQTAILWPTIAMVVLIHAVLIVMIRQRVKIIRASPPTESDFVNAEASARYFQPAELSGANLRNMFEMPVLFFALVPLLIVTHHASSPQVALAWAYVLLRAGHSFIHIVVRNVVRRFALFIASCMVLGAMWIGLAIDLAR